MATVRNKKTELAFAPFFPLAVFKCPDCGAAHFLNSLDADSQIYYICNGNKYNKKDPCGWMGYYECGFILMSELQKMKFYIENGLIGANGKYINGTSEFNRRYNDIFGVNYVDLKTGGRLINLNEKQLFCSCDVIHNEE
jgi:hypothetical protein